MEFKEFNKIENLKRCVVTVTEKLHGSNCSLFIFKDENGVLQLKPGKRTSFVTVENDNFGFARFVEERKQQLIECLGEGIWYGEWVGPGINSTYNLQEKRLALFATWKQGCPLPDRCDFVPVLWKGTLDTLNIPQIMKDLKENGSKYSPGFLSPEGIVVSVDRTELRFKYVFDPEETKWTGSKKVSGTPKDPLPDVSNLLQPLRLTKLLTKDESLISNFPTNFADIAGLYIQDLIDEGQLIVDDDIRIKRKAIGKQFLPFVESTIMNLRCKT